MEQHGKCPDKIREFLDPISDSDRDFLAIRSDAFKAIAKLQNENEKSFNAKRKAPIIYKEGDYVVVRNIDTTPGINKKLIPKFKGPYVIQKVLDFDRYVITDPDGHQLTRISYTSIVSADQMKP